MKNEIEIRTIAEAEQLAAHSAKSKLFSTSDQSQLLVILLTGKELGLSPMASVRGIYVVQGKPVLSADAMVAIIRRSGICVSWTIVESTADRCEIHTVRKGDEMPQKCVWTKADGQRISGSKDTWRNYPAQMLRHRCAADLARMVYPDVILGLYTPEELGEDTISEQEPTPVNVEVVTEDSEKTTVTLAECAQWIDNAKSRQELTDARHAIPPEFQSQLKPNVYRARCRLAATLEELEEMFPLIAKSSPELSAEYTSIYNARRAELEGPKDDGPKGGKRKPAVKSADATGSANEVAPDLSNPATALAVLRSCKAPQHAVSHYAKHHAHKPLNQREMLRNALVAMLWQRWSGVVPTRDHAERMVAASEAESAVRVAA